MSKKSISREKYSLKCLEGMKLRLQEEIPGLLFGRVEDMGGRGSGAESDKSKDPVAEVNLG